MSTISGVYGGPQLQMLARLLQPDPASQTGQNVPRDGGEPVSTSVAPAPPPPAQPEATASSRFAGRTLSALLGAQEQPSSTDLANRLIGQVDTNGDGALSLQEVTAAIGQGGGAQTADASNLTAAFASLDTNGDGDLSASELASALDAMKQAHHGHGHHHHSEDAGASGQVPSATSGSAPTSSDLASQIISKVDANGDGSLSLDEITSGLGANTSSTASGSSAFSGALAKLDANGDGALSASELSAALQALQQSLTAQFASTAASSIEAQAVTSV